MKTKIITLLLSAAFLSAGAFAHGGQAARTCNWGASTVLQGQY